MDTVINVSDHVTNSMGVTPEEARPVYDAVLATLKDGGSVILNFANVTMLTTAFLNVAIGDLYRDFKSEELKGRLHLEGVDGHTKLRVKKVIETAKAFYGNEERFTRNVEEAMYGGV